MCDLGISTAEPEPLGGRGILRAPLYRWGVSRSGRRECCGQETAVGSHALEQVPTTNHIFQSILSRSIHSAWRTIARPTGLQLSEAAARLPSYVSGILLVGVVALLAARFGLAWEGALAAWLIAIHPWHMRFTTEARGYGLVALLILVSCLLAVHALDRGQWKWWIALAMANFALLYTWPPTLFTRPDPEPLHRRQSSHGEAILSRADCPYSPMARFRDLCRDCVFAVVPAVCTGPFELFEKRPRF